MSSMLRRIRCAIVVKRDKALLLQLKKKYGQWEIPGGKLDGVETSLECAKRELYEETGLIWIDGYQLGYVNYRDKYGCVVHVCTEWEGDLKLMEPDKQSAIGWFDILPENLTADTQTTLKEFKDIK